METPNLKNSLPDVRTSCQDVVPTEDNCIVAEEPKRTKATYFEYCEEMDPEYAERIHLEEVSKQVGTNDVIVDNVLRFCDIKTLRQCCLVNQLWRILTLNNVKLHFDNRYQDGCYYNIPNIRLDMEKVFRKKTKIQPYHCIQIDALRPTSSWKRYSPNLRVLSLEDVVFRKMDDVYRVVFDSFPNMQELKLAGVMVKTDPIVDAPLKDYHVATPKLQKLIIHDHVWYNFTFVNADFCFKGISKLRNLKELTFYGSSTNQEVPIFQALARGNIQLETLKYKHPRRAESSAIINNYLRRYGASLRFIEGHFVGKEYQDIFRGFVAKNLKHMEVRFDDYRWAFRGQFPNLEKIVIDHYRVESVAMDGGERLLEPLPPGPRILSVREVSFYPFLSEREFETARERQQELESLFKMFPNMTTLGFLNINQDEVLEAIKLAVIHSPNLEHLQIEAFSQDGWRGVTSYIALNLTGLKFLYFKDEDNLIHAQDLLPLLLLPKLHTLSVEKAEIPRRLFELLKDQVPNLIISELRIHQ